MRRTIMMLFLFVMSIGIFAQESELEKKQREYRFATTEEKALMDSLYQPIADKLLKEQVKTIGGIFLSVFRMTKQRRCLGTNLEVLSTILLQQHYHSRMSSMQGVILPLYTFYFNQMDLTAILMLASSS